MVLSGRDESHLGFVGVACEQPIEEGTLVDIGGGSTELTCVRAGADERGVSIPAGSLSSCKWEYSYFLFKKRYCK